MGRVLKASSLHMGINKMRLRGNRSETARMRKMLSKRGRHGKDCVATSGGSPDLIIVPNGTHTHTVILLHGLYYDGESFAPLPQKLQELFGETCAGAKGIKYIFPNAPLRTISWPDGEEEGASSWYNYFTRRDGELEDDEIDISHLREETKKIHNLINEEVKKLGDPRRIILGGNSQGGTVACNAALTCEQIVGGLLILRSNLLSLTTVDKAWNSLPVYIFRAELDDIFCHELTAQRFKQFVDNNFMVTEWVEKNLSHTDESVCELLYSAKWIGKCFFGIDARVKIADRPDGPSPP